MHKVAVVVILLAILAISAYDAYRCVTDASILQQIEVNPIAYWLIKLDGGRVAILIAAKTMGTGIVGCVMGWLVAAKRWSVFWPSAVVLFLVQLFVLARYMGIGI